MDQYDPSQSAAPQGGYSQQVPYSAAATPTASQGAAYQVPYNPPTILAIYQSCCCGNHHMTVEGLRQASIVTSAWHPPSHRPRSPPSHRPWQQNNRHHHSNQRPYNNYNNNNHQDRRVPREERYEPYPPRSRSRARKSRSASSRPKRKSKTPPPPAAPLPDYDPNEVLKL